MKKYLFHISIMLFFVANVMNAAGRVLEEGTNRKKVNFTHYTSGQVKTSTLQNGHAITLDYDLFGRVSQETYPGGYFIINKYDQYGYLTGLV